MYHDWEFSIDVGGTFTDCMGRAPDGEIHTCKFLSSGIIKGKVENTGKDFNSFVDPSRIGAPEHFFDKYKIKFINKDKKIIEQTVISEFISEKGLFFLEKSIYGIFSGTTYEIFSDEEAPVICIRYLKKLRLNDPVGKVIVKVGTTKGTNALLERKGAKTAFITTKNFADILEIGTQARPELFSLKILKPYLLYNEAEEVDERTDASGNIIKPADENEIRLMFKSLKDKNIESVAICFINSYKNPINELTVEKIAQETGFKQISVSSKLSPVIKFLNRGDTTLVDAYISPIIKQYVANILKSIPEGNLKLMTSSGGLVSPENFSGKESVLSGPAGGVTGYSYIAERAGFNKAIGFDMGGTSTDVSRFDGKYEYQFETEKAGVRIVTPMYAIETIAAGGGSICSFDGQKLMVGPESSGAEPGPASYGKGGPLSITDINLFNGKIDERNFPFPLDKKSVTDELEKISIRIKTETQTEMSLIQIAEGFIEIADNKMATAIKNISTSKGYDPGEYVLVSFGGAGAQHSCSVAELLGIRKILLHKFAGILSAFGIGIADIERFKEKTILCEFSEENLKIMEDDFKVMEDELVSMVIKEGVSKEKIKLPERMIDLRYWGEESSITVSESENQNYIPAFEKLHNQLYGHIYKGRKIEVVTIRVKVTGENIKPEEKPAHKTQNYPQPGDYKTTYFKTVPYNTPVYFREKLTPGDKITGPAIIAEKFSTIVINPGWISEVNEYFDIVLTDTQNREIKSDNLNERDPVKLELFNNIFTNIAARMGIILQKTSLSVNVKERLDFSCAILDSDGELVVNAPHIPVHLGAMSESVKALIKDITQIEPGDVYVSNSPYTGGSHLPDITVITPVFDKEGEKLLFFTASRAHHAEIGGLFPGSAYPFAKNLSEEGVVLKNLKVVENNVFREELLMKELTGAKYPSRLPEENIADIRAAIAANKAGENELLSLIQKYSRNTVKAYMKHIRDSTEEKMKTVINNFPVGEYKFEDYLDDGRPIKVRIEINNEKMIIDFTGSGKVSQNSLNANKAVVQSAVIFCLRCLINENIPLNSGVLEPVKIIFPEGMLNPPANENPENCPAIFGGNVEISQKIVDVIFGALGVMAASQGTMNNFIFGNDNFGYYETICGGTGAGPDFDGTSAVHSHMTNTRMTDPEIIENKYPVRLKNFKIRKDSGGKGKYSGGNGVIREIEFLEPVQVSLLTQRRKSQPFGLKGGENGKRGENILHHKGKTEYLDSLVQVKVEVGDSIEIRTPGGGGFGYREQINH